MHGQPSQGPSAVDFSIALLRRTFLLVEPSDIPGKAGWIPSAEPGGPQIAALLSPCPRAADPGQFCNLPELLAVMFVSHCWLLNLFEALSWVL